MFFFALLWWKQPTTTYMVCFCLTFFLRLRFSFKLCGRPHVILQNVNKNCPQVVENFEHTCMFEWLCRKRNGTFKLNGKKEEEGKTSIIETAEKHSEMVQWEKSKKYDAIKFKEGNKKIIQRKLLNSFFLSFYISVGKQVSSVRRNKKNHFGWGRMSVFLFLLRSCLSCNTSVRMKCEENREIPCTALHTDKNWIKWPIRRRGRLHFYWHSKCCMSLVIRITFVNVMLVSATSRYGRLGDNNHNAITIMPNMCQNISSIYLFLSTQVNTMKFRYNNRPIRRNQKCCRITLDGAEKKGCHSKPLRVVT